MFNNKKGAMQLSINMIVILIIAVVVIGLALGFITKTFESMTDNFESKMGDEQPPETATVNNFLTSSRSSITIRKGESIPIRWSTYCNATTGCFDTAISMACSVTSNPLTLDATVKNITTKKVAEFASIIKAPTNAAEKSQVCTFTFKYNTTHGNAETTKTIASKDINVIVK